MRAVEELLASPLDVRGILAAPQLGNAPRGAQLLDTILARGVDLVQISALDFASAAETDSPQGVLAIGAVPDRPIDAFEPGERTRLVVLDAVQDPGNVGTILRTAAALGAAGVIAMPGTVDLWNAKVVRSAMGALFHHPAFSASWPELDALRKVHEFALWGADASGTPLEALEAPARLALLVGNEGAGLSEEGRRRVEQLAALPISSAVESLNVAVATGILLYQLRK